MKLICFEANLKKKKNGRFYARGPLFVSNELGQTVLVRLVIRFVVGLA